MKLTEEEKKAAEESIEHWKKDILLRFLDGDTILSTWTTPAGANYGQIRKLNWVSDGKEVKCFSEQCKLCALYLTREVLCGACLYAKKHGFPCTAPGEAWAGFINNPTQGTCENMISALEAILED